MVIERILKSHKTQLQNPVCSLKHTVMEDDAETSKPFCLQHMTNNQITVSGHDTTECHLPKLKPNVYRLRVYTVSRITIYYLSYSLISHYLQFDIHLDTSKSV